MRTYYAEIPVKDLHIPRDRYQREPEKLDQYKKDGWQERLYRPIDVSKHGKTYWVMDGGHRTELAQCFGVTHLQAKVYEGLTYEEEARLFVDLNDPRYQKSVTPIQRMRGEVEARDENALAIQRIIKSAGFKLTNAPGRNTIQGVTALKRVFATHGYNVLKQSLQVLREAWNGEPGSTQSQFIGGIARFIVTFSNDPSHSRTMDRVLRDLAASLAKVPISDVMRASKALSPRGNAITNESVARAMTIYYNKGRRQGRLDEMAVSRSESTSRGMKTRAAKAAAAHPAPRSRAAV